MDPLHEGQVSIWTGTWNMHGRVPSDEAAMDWIPEGYHIYAIGTQECAAPISRSLVKPETDFWEQSLGRVFSQHPARYICLKSHTLAATHLSVFARQDLLPLITGI